MNQDESPFDAIRNLKGRYFRTIDTKQFDQLHDFLTDDAYFDIEGIVERHVDGTITVPESVRDLFPGSQRAIVQGRDRIVDFIAGALGPVISVHHGFTPEIEVEGDHAKAIWPMEDIFFEIAAPHRKLRQAYGHYADVYRKERGAWRIAGQALTFLHQRWF